MAKHEDEKPDGLEIIAIGKLYSGLWDKKYWSSSRGKDRYPYPVGYKAVRTQYGITYTMEILEGVKGPVFMRFSCKIDGADCGEYTIIRAPPTGGPKQFVKLFEKLLVIGEVWSPSHMADVDGNRFVSIWSGSWG